MNSEVAESYAEQIRRLTPQLTRTVFHRVNSPSEEFSALADASKSMNLTEWDVYGDGGAVSRLEEKVSGLLAGKSAVFFPSGIMAQQIALRIHADTQGSRTIALPQSSHLLVHEEDGPRILHGFNYAPLSGPRKLPTVSSLNSLSEPLGAVLLEIPLRDAGCALPEWAQLKQFSETCAQKRVPLHLDGARLWEAAAAWEKPVGEVAQLADTVYVSFYKGLGALAGAVLAGTEEFSAQARKWRRRMGGTTYHATAVATSALSRLETQLPLIPSYINWAKRFHRALPSEIRTAPNFPETNQFYLYAQADPEKLNQRVLEVMVEHNVAFSRPWQATSVPGQSVTEIAVGSGSVQLDPEEAANLYGKVIQKHE